MPDVAARLYRAQSVWSEGRSDVRPVIAPYPERGPAHAWKWDRPADLLVGRVLAAQRPGRHPLAARADAIVAASEALRDLDDATFDARCADMRARLMRGGLSDAALIDECLALIREVTGREMGMRHFAVQLIGRLIMGEWGLAGMARGGGGRAGGGGG